jgi:hypothetical protein
MRAAIAFVLIFIACRQNPLMAGDDQRIVRFYGGEVVRAEIKPDDGSVKVVNVNKFAPRSRVTSDVGYAVVTVRMDKGRSLGIYDYSLVNSRRDAFPCIAIMNSVEEFDASLRELKKTKPNKFYTLLFKVEMPLPNQKPEYLLRFNLIRGKNRDPRLHFVDVGKHPFTKTSKIPLEGMLGVVPDWPKPKPKPPPKPVEKPKPAADAKAKKSADKAAQKKSAAKKEASKKAPAKPAAKKPVAPKKKTQPSKAKK